MSRWLDRVDGLLFEGETVQETVEFGDAAGRGVVVTSHRMLAFTPTGDGANYRAVDRPNVDGVERSSRGRALFLVQAVKAGVVGAVLLVAGRVVSLDGLVTGVDVASGTGELGLGGFLSAMQTLLDLLALLDEALTVAGALCLLLGVALAGAYLHTREDQVRIRVAGEEDVTLPAPAEEGVAARIERAVRPDAGGSPGTGSTADGPPESDPLA